MKNDTFLRALARQPTPYAPVWLMRQAGRYLPEYNATRARAGSFLALARNPELCAEVALQPLERFALDAAIVFSDILTIPDAMGLGLSLSEGEGPRFQHPLRDEAAIRRLAAPDPSAELRYVLEVQAKVMGFSPRAADWVAAARELLDLARRVNGEESAETVYALYELGTALRINPHDIDALKDTIMRAIDMPPAEQGRRMRALRRKVLDNDVASWSRSFLDALTWRRAGSWRGLARSIHSRRRGFGRSEVSSPSCGTPSTRGRGRLGRWRASLPRRQAGRYPTTSSPAAFCPRPFACSSAAAPTTISPPNSWRPPTISTTTVR